MKNNGVTLIEVMVAVAILAIAFTAVLKSQAQSVSMVTHARFTTTAAILAQSKMAEMEAADTGNIQAGSGDFGDDFPGYAWKVTVDDTEFDNLRRIAVTVSNALIKSENSYTLVLYRFIAL